MLLCVDIRRIYSSIAQNLKFDWSIQISWKRKAAGKSGLFEQVLICAGTTTEKLRNNSAVIVSCLFGAGDLFS